MPSKATTSDSGSGRKSNQRAIQSTLPVHHQKRVGSSRVESSRVTFSHSLPHSQMPNAKRQTTLKHTHTHTLGVEPEGAAHSVRAHRLSLSAAAAREIPSPPLSAQVCNFPAVPGLVGLLQCCCLLPLSTGRPAREGSVDWAVDACLCLSQPRSTGSAWRHPLCSQSHLALLLARLGQCFLPVIVFFCLTNRSANSPFSHTFCSFESIRIF